jgi:cytochrome c biogenesis protein
MATKISRIAWKFIYSLGNLQLAITLLLFIATLSTLGTIIEQEKVTTFYETNYPIDKPFLGFITSDFIIFLGLNHVYTTNWFVLLLLVFGGSLLSCTVTRQIPSLKLAKLWQFIKKEKISFNSGVSFNLPNVSLNQFSYLLRKTNYNVIQQGPYLYAYKGLIGKIGPIFVHLSIIIVLLGSIAGSLFGFMVQELVPKEELFHLQNVIVSGPLSYIRQDFEGYVDDFKIAYSDQGSIDQFYSDIQILDNDLKSYLKKTIFVNEPLKYDGITFYQTDWSIASLTIDLNDNEKLQIPVQEITTENNTRFWIGDLNDKNNIIIILQDLTGNYLLYDSEKNFLGQGEVGHKLFLDGNRIRVNEIVPSTGLQIKVDPGITLIYFGFLLLIVSVMWSYTSYFQIWAIKKDGKLCVYGDTNRAIYFFEKNILEILETLKSQVVIF